MEGFLISKEGKGEKEMFRSSRRVELLKPFDPFNPSLYDLVGIVG
jgi:hypothetical protein